MGLVVVLRLSDRERMADKSVNIIEPVASDIESITVIYDGAGNPASIDISSVIRTSDSNVRYAGNCSAVLADFTTEEQA